MSFILDALKKSESDRQRHNGPALFEVKVAPRRAGLPAWGFAIAALLGINLVIVIWMLLRHPAPHADAAATVTPAAAPVAAPAAAPQAVPVPSPAVTTTAAPATVAPAGAATVVQTPVANAAQAQGLPPAGTGTTAAAAAGEVNPEDTAPAAEPAPMLGSHVRRGTADGVPLYQDASVVPGTHIPQLRLDLHVYAARPEERFVMINMKKLREGDAVDGAHVESITPDGVILSYSGSRFLMPSQ
jgi:general secretion pathway protein B